MAAQDISSESLNAINEKIRIHPNPTASSINILTEEEIKKVEILDAKNSKRVYQGTKSNIDLSNQKKGIYIIVVTTKNNTYTKKVIRN
jgi:hypothetical protein